MDIMRYTSPTLKYTCKNSWCLGVTSVLQNKQRQKRKTCQSIKLLSVPLSLWQSCNEGN